MVLFLAVFIGLTVAMGLLFISSFGFYAYYQFSGKIVPGVEVGAVKLGGKTTTEAAIELQKVWNLETRIQVTNGIQSYELSPAELGLSIDPLQTAGKAHEVAHGGWMVDEISQLVKSIKDGWQVAPVITLDSELARLQLEALAPQMSGASKNAAIHVESGEIVAVPGELGYTVNIEDTLADLNADPGRILTTGVLQLTLKPVIPAVMDAGEALAEAQVFLDTPVCIEAYDPISNQYNHWQVPQTELATWLLVDTDPNGSPLALDPRHVGSYLNKLSQELAPDQYLDSARYREVLAESIINGQSHLITVSHHPTTYAIQPNDTLLKIGWKLRMPYWMILQANPDVDPDALWVGTELVIPSRDKLLPLPVVLGKRIVISISKQHIWIYKDGEQIRDYKISTGIDRSPTQPGVFQVQTHDSNAYASVWDLYMPNFIGIYESWPGFMNGIHGLPTLSNGRRLWANILGSPASYGCIILDLKPSDWLFNWAEKGVVVEILP